MGLSGRRSNPQIKGKAERQAGLHGQRGLDGGSKVREMTPPGHSAGVIDGVEYLRGLLGS
jgi:hypothetical protein